MALVLTHDERREFEARLRSRKIRSEDARLGTENAELKGG